MLRGYRLLFVAFAGLILAGAQQPSEHAKADNSAQQEQASPKQAASPTPPPEPPYRPYPKYNPDPCYRADNHDAADLCAQWRAAIAAEKAAHEARRATNWGIAAAGLSFATLVGLIVTILQTQGALGEARKANLITQRTNALAEKSDKRRDRAYIAVQPGGIIMNADGKTAKAHIIVKNWGKIHAKSVDVYMRSCISGFKETENFPVENRSDRVNRVIQPTDEMRQGAKENLDPIVIKNQGNYIFVWGVVYYEDGFGEKRFTKFCHRYSESMIELDIADTMPPSLKFRTREGVLIGPEKARIHTHGNDAD